MLRSLFVLGPDGGFGGENVREKPCARGSDAEEEVKAAEAGGVDGVSEGVCDKGQCVQNVGLRVYTNYGFDDNVDDLDREADGHG